MKKIVLSLILTILISVNVFAENTAVKFQIGIDYGFFGGGELQKISAGGNELMNSSDLNYFADPVSNNNFANFNLLLGFNLKTESGLFFNPKLIIGTTGSKSYLSDLFYIGSNLGFLDINRTQTFAFDFILGNRIHKGELYDVSIYGFFGLMHSEVEVEEHFYDESFTITKNISSFGLGVRFEYPIYFIDVYLRHTPAQSYSNSTYELEYSAMTSLNAILSFQF